MPIIRVMRPSGGHLETTVADAEVAQLMTIKDLKVYLAAADESRPPTSLVQLFDPGKAKPKPDDAGIPRRAVIDPDPSVPLLQYVITDDVMSILRRRDDQTGEWPNTDHGREQPWKMFDPKVAEKARQSGYHVSCGFQGCKEFIDALKWVVLGLSQRKVNEIYADGTTLLSRMCRCTIEFGQKLQAFEFDTLLLEFIQLESLQVDTIDRSLRLLEEEQEKLWHLPHGTEVLLALTYRDAGRECWAGAWWPHGDNLLQYILDPVFCWVRRTDVAGKLCLALAEKFRLDEFCHLNDNGFCALNYTEGLVEQAKRMGEGEEELWLQVREAIKFNMIQRFLEHPGPLKRLGEITDQLWSKSYGGTHVAEVLRAFEEDLRQRIYREQSLLHLHDLQVSRHTIEVEIEDILSENCKMHAARYARPASQSNESCSESG
ncbi:unnamed protein product [Durusdinium trenchii]|uniref:Uncharacterized protein n=2 Tax=Durusdinium trenchii TaxID=1381693 RepID=A0ABP0SQJ1_9DINO